MMFALFALGWLAFAWLTVHLILRWWRQDFPVDGPILVGALFTGVALGPLGLLVPASLYLSDRELRISDGLLRFFAIRDNGGSNK